MDLDLCQGRGVDKGLAVCVRGGHGECAVFYANVTVTRLEPTQRRGP